MSFADDLQKPDIKRKDYRWENEIVKECIGAIKEACLSSKKNGKKYIRGGYYFDGTDYGSYRIIENFDGTIFENQDTSYEYIKESIIKGIKELGFSRFNVIHKEAEIKTVIGKTLFGKPKTRGTGKTGHSFYIEIEW